MLVEVEEGWLVAELNTVEGLRREGSCINVAFFV